MTNRREFVEDWSFFNDAMVRRASKIDPETGAQVTHTVIHEVRAEQRTTWTGPGNEAPVIEQASTRTGDGQVSNGQTTGSAAAAPMSQDDFWKIKSARRPQTSGVATDAASVPFTIDGHTVPVGSGLSASLSDQAQAAREGRPMPQMTAAQAAAAQASAPPLSGNGGGSGAPPHGGSPAASTGPSVPPGSQPGWQPARSAPISSNISWQTAPNGFMRALREDWAFLWRAARWIITGTCAIFLICLVGALVMAMVTGIPHMFTKAEPIIPAATSLPQVAMQRPVATTTGTGLPMVTDYTTFNTVAVGNNKVVTGWKFAHSGDAQPSSQYCYLDVGNAGGSRSFTIEERPGGVKEKPDVLIPGLDERTWKVAAAQCVWHQ